MLLNTVDPSHAEGLVAKVYEGFTSQVGAIPVPLELLSASPRLFEQRVHGISTYRVHPTLRPVLLTTIRYLTARARGFQACIDFNARVLRQGGLSQEQVEGLRPETAPLEERERALLALAMRALTRPGEVDAAALDEVRALGWSDADILEAVAHGADLLTLGALVRAFAS